MNYRLVIAQEAEKVLPANILVTSDGTPKLLDFGIAKLRRPPGGFARGDNCPGAGRLAMALITH